jgi:hypothetical protein
VSAALALEAAILNRASAATRRIMEDDLYSPARIRVTDILASHL